LDDGKGVREHIDNRLAWEARLALWHDLIPRLGLMGDREL
jgi:hypothetical protein